MRRHFASLSPGDRAGWIGTLLMLPVAEAIAMTRTQLAGDAAASRGSGATNASAIEPPAATPRDSTPATGPAAKPTAPRRTSRNQPGATTSATTLPTVATDPAPTDPAPTRATVSSGATAALPTTAAADALASTTPAITAPAAAAPPTTPEPAAVAGSELVSAAPPARALTRSAHTHLADIESALRPEERLMVHTLIAGLSPEERDVWLDTLLSVPSTEGVAMLRDTLHTRTSERHGVPLAIGAASVPVMVGAGEQLDDDQDDHDPDNRQQDDHEDDDHEDDDHEDDDQRPDSEAALAMSDALPTLDEASLAHFQAIEDALTLAEKMRAHELAAQRPAAELRAWYAELREMSVPDAVAKLRTELED